MGSRRSEGEIKHFSVFHSAEGTKRELWRIAVALMIHVYGVGQF